VAKKKTKKTYLSRNQKLLLGLTVLSAAFALLFASNIGNFRTRLASIFANPTVRGTLVTEISEGLKSGVSYKHVVQLIDGKRVSVTANQVTNIRPGSVVDIPEKAVFDSIQSGGIYSSDPNAQISMVSAPSIQSTGTKKAAVILVSYQSSASTTPTVSSANSIFTNEIRPYFTESSFGKLTLSGDVYGRFTIRDPGSCDVYSVVSLAVAAADTTVNFSQYDHVVVVHPDLYGCGQAYASVGGGYAYPTGEGDVVLMSVTVPDTFYNAGAIAHEIGHNYGLKHSNGYECGSNVIANSGCSSVEYGDLWDIMGKGGLRHFHGMEKEALGWLGVSNVKSVTAASTQTLYPIESTTTQPQTLKIRRRIVNQTTGKSEWFYVTSRKATGADASLPANATNGVTVHLISGDDDPIWTNGPTNLLDMTPQSTADDFSDAGLSVGQQFTDPVSGIGIKLISKNSTSASVQITGTIPTPAPTPTQAPSKTVEIVHIPVSATRMRTNFDAVDMNGAVTDQEDPIFSYTGTWGTWYSSAVIGGSYRQASTTDTPQTNKHAVSFQMPDSTTSLKISTFVAYNSANFEVYVGGVKKYTFVAENFPSGQTWVTVPLGSATASPTPTPTATSNPRYVDRCYKYAYKRDNVLYWPNACYRQIPPVTNCIQLETPLTSDEVYSYNVWVSNGRPTIPGCDTTSEPVTPTPDPGGGEPAGSPSQNIVLNPSFENTGSSWLSPWRYKFINGAAGKVYQDGSNSTDGSKSVRVSITSAASTAWYAQLQQSRLGFTAGERYKLSFWARASAPRTIEVLIQKGYSPYTVYYGQSNVQLATTWKQYTFEYIPTVSESNFLLVFNLAKTTGQVWIDNVSFSK